MAAPQNRGNSRAWAPKGPKTGGRSPQTGAKTPERRKRPIFAPWPPKRGNTRPRDTQTRSEPDKRLPWHPARSACLQNRLGHKKTPPEGIRTAPLTSSNCPRGKTVCLDKAARRVGAGREDGKRKKAPQLQRPRGEWSVRSRVWAEPWRRAIVRVISDRRISHFIHKIADLIGQDSIVLDLTVGKFFRDAVREGGTAIRIGFTVCTASAGVQWDDIAII